MNFFSGVFGKLSFYVYRDRLSLNGECVSVFLYGKRFWNYYGFVTHDFNYKSSLFICTERKQTFCNKQQNVIEKGLFFAKIYVDNTLLQV